MNTNQKLHRFNRDGLVCAMLAFLVPLITALFYNQPHLAGGIFIGIAVRLAGYFDTRRFIDNSFPRDAP